MKKNYILFLFFPVLYFSQMTTDRPGEGTSSEIIAPKTLQLESGINYFGGDTSFSSDHVLRLGLAKKWEVRLETDQDFSDSKESTYGFSSKFNFLESKNSAPSLTLIAGSDFKFDEYSFLLSSDKLISEKLAASANIGYQRVDYDNFLFTSFGLEYSFTDRLSSFAEYFGNYNSKISPDHNLDFGFTYLASPRLKVDLSAGSSFENISDNYFVSTGVSYQFN